MSDSVRPHRWQPSRLPRLWDSPGKNTGVGCHFLLQSMKVKSESEVAQLCPTLSDPMDCSLPGSSIHGIFQARVLEWGAIAFSVPVPKEKKRRVIIVVALVIVVAVVSEVLTVVILVSHHNSRNSSSPVLSSSIILVPLTLAGKFTHRDFWEFPRGSHKLLALRVTYSFPPAMD